MQKTDYFKDFHPTVIFLYFIIAIAFSIFVLNPFLLIISVLGSLLYLTYLKGFNELFKISIRIIPVAFITAIVNPLFNHEGATVIRYFKNGNPLTLESIYYGICSGLMLLATLLWFNCYNNIVSNDKLMYVSGRAFPSLALIISMTMRFIPYFAKQFRKTSEIQNTFGFDQNNSNLLQKIKNALTVFSIMTTWTLENSIELSDSMKSRGYGFDKRTFFSIYNFGKKDKFMLLFLIVSAVYISVGFFKKTFHTSFFPTFKTSVSSYSISVLAVYLMVVVSPILYNLYANYSWNKKIEKGAQSVDGVNQFAP